MRRMRPPRRPDMESAIALYCVAPDQPQPPALFNPEAWQKAQLKYLYAHTRLGLLRPLKPSDWTRVVTPLDARKRSVLSEGKRKESDGKTTKKTLKTAPGDVGDATGSMPSPRPLDWEAMCCQGDGEWPL
jgi:hypothetical protein